MPQRYIKHEKVKGDYLVADITTGTVEAYPSTFSLCKAKGINYKRCSKGYKDKVFISYEDYKGYYIANNTKALDRCRPIAYDIYNTQYVVTCGVEIISIFKLHNSYWAISIHPEKLLANESYSFTKDNKNFIVKKAEFKSRFSIPPLVGDTELLSHCKTRFEGITMGVKKG